ncbi:hypothetical protein PMAYCL1PPCAC_13988, partial [Pristionchus mayeri]
MEFIGDEEAFREILNGISTRRRRNMDSTAIDPIANEGGEKDTFDSVPEVSNVISGSVNCKESMDDSDMEDEPMVKKSKKE